ncbi:T9SS type A sorting domain-containing protein [Bacteroides sedimenti]|uniref:Sialate O-acetylesterase domain-containing protein n=1 Tax=Bacteroides sedimenti TaxID=2136147 RepID=A0ABM8I8Y2_9BACE
MFNVDIFNVRNLIKVMVLLINNFLIIATAQEYQHLIIYGQSLSVGSQSWPPLSTTPVSGNYMIGDQVWINYGNTSFNKLTPLVANVASETMTLPKNRANKIFAECPLVAATNHIQLKTEGKYKFIATSCGTVAKSIEELSKEHYDPICYRDFTSTINYASLITSKIHCPAIIWMQGEYNYLTQYGNTGLTEGSTPTSDKLTYKSLLIQLKNNMQADIRNKYRQADSPLFITYQVGAQYTRGDSVSIGMAQLEASNEYHDVVCAGPVYPMTDRGGHLDPNGYRWYGEMLGKAYYQTITLGKKFRPLQPLEISRMDDKRTLRIKFLVPQKPLVLDEMLVRKAPDYGFEVFNNGVEVNILNVSVDNEYVYLTCENDLDGDVELIYAGTNNSGQGNLRDSDSFPASYSYQDLDKKNQDNSYVYGRDISETTLRPDNEPKDSEGIIYNKPYPLYNFCVAFYYKLMTGMLTYHVPNLDTSNDSLPINFAKVYLNEGILKIETNISDIVKIDLLDISGKQIIIFPLEDNDGLKLYSFDLPHMSKGVYFVRIASSKVMKISKLFL